MARVDTTYNEMMVGPSGSHHFCTVCGEFVRMDNYIEYGIIATPAFPTPSRKWGFHRDCVPKLVQSLEKGRMNQGVRI